MPATATVCLPMQMGGVARATPCHLNNGAIGNGMDPDTFHANASLIAAAPDILESLLDYYHLPEVWVNDPDGTVADAVKAEVRERARAAIAKATGQDSV